MFLGNATVTSPQHGSPLPGGNGSAVGAVREVTAGGELFSEQFFHFPKQPGSGASNC